MSVVGGSLDAHLDATVRDLLALEPRLGPVLLVVACGRNAGLYERLRHAPGSSPCPGADDLPDLIRVVDCVVQNSGGFTTLRRSAPAPPGVVPVPVRAWGDQRVGARPLGMAAWPRTPEELEALGAALARGPGVCAARWTGRPELVDVLAGWADHRPEPLEAVG
ncbi:MAG: hypothetical protein R2731_11175 [Nocardioides sp.]